jgi:hypothetical protein
MYKIKTIWTLAKHYIASEVTPNVTGEVKSNLPCTLKKPFLSFFFQNFPQIFHKEKNYYIFWWNFRSIWKKKRISPHLELDFCLGGFFLKKNFHFLDKLYKHVTTKW